VLIALADVGSGLVRPEDTPAGLFEFDNATLIGRIIYPLLLVLGQAESFKQLFEAFEKGRSLGLIVHEISVLGQEHGKYSTSTDPRAPDNERIVSSSELSDLEQLGLRRIRESAKAWTDLLSQPFVAGLLYRWREWAGESEVRQWVSRVINTDEGLLRLLEGFLRVGSSSDEGRTFEMDLNDLRPFVDPIGLVNRRDTGVAAGSNAAD